MLQSTRYLRHIVNAARRSAMPMIVALAMPLLPWLAGAADEHYLKDGVAVPGIDVVAYHTVGKPTTGSAQFTAEYQGATWHFASTANRDLFVASPAKYAPAYGGWCSAGASKGKKVATKPEFWAIVDGQLYLNSSDAAHSKLFLGDTAGTIRKGESNWKTIYATEASKL
jgi:YHS domain-containing protein